jgi:hypothetical protein
MSQLVDVDVAQSNVPRPGLVLGLLRPVWRYCLAWAQDFSCLKVSSDDPNCVVANTTVDTKDCKSIPRLRGLEDR